MCAANTVDSKAAYEAVFSLWGAINGGAKMLMHGAGWLEGGLCCSYEKVMLDIDLLQMVTEFLQPVSTSPEDLALEAINEVGPAGHFFGTETYMMVLRLERARVVTYVSKNASGGNEFQAWK